MWFLPQLIYMYTFHKEKRMTESLKKYIFPEEDLFVESAKNNIERAMMTDAESRRRLKIANVIGHNRQ